MSLDSTDLSKIVSLSAKPSKFNFLHKLNLSDEVISKLSLNLSRVLTGSSDIYFTPIGKDNDPDSLLKQLDELFNSNSNLINDNLRDLELSNRSKFGPRSISKPWKERLPSLLDYFEHQDDPQNLSLRLLNSASHKLRPLSLSSASGYLKNSTNSGLPYYTKKGLIKDRVISDFKSLISRQDPCVLFTRTQEAGKTRNVWGYPMADTLNEMIYYQPLLSYQRKQVYRSALNGPDIVDRHVTEMILRNRSQGNHLVSIDFSSFDASVGKNLQSLCFSYISNLFQSNCSLDLDYIKHRFNTIGVITPNGVISGEHGVPSGATFTNEVDSLAQYIVATNSGVINDGNMQIQGDDGVYGLKHNDVDKLLNSFRLAGLNVNEDKSYTSTDFVVYLQRLYDIHYIERGTVGGIYSIYRALNRIIYQERYSDFMDFSLKGVDYYSIRTITILENCKYHPLFKDFVKLVAKFDKFGLNYDVNSLSNYIRMLDGAGTSGFLNNQFGDNIKGINNFETVKILKEIRR
jgi:hypothetical protein